MVSKNDVMQVKMDKSGWVWKIRSVSSGCIQKWIPDRGDVEATVQVHCPVFPSDLDGFQSSPVPVSTSWRLHPSWFPNWQRQSWQVDHWGWCGHPLGWSQTGQSSDGVGVLASEGGQNPDKLLSQVVCWRTDSCDNGSHWYGLLVDLGESVYLGCSE